MFKNLCRICLLEKENDSLQSIYENIEFGSENLDIAQAICFCTHLSVTTKIFINIYFLYNKIDFFYS